MKTHYIILVGKIAGIIFSLFLSYILLTFPSFVSEEITSIKSSRWMSLTGIVLIILAGILSMTIII